jgi:hypothetical protein
VISKILCFSVFVATISSAAGEIDLTPSVREYTSQGFVFRQVKLKQATQEIMFVMPPDWSVSGTKDRLQMLPPNKNFAEGTITASPLAGSKPFDEATAKALEQRVLSEAPPGSQAVQVVRREENPVPIGPNPSLEIVISYATLGHTFHRSVIFVNTADTQLAFRFTSPKEDFTALNASFRRSVASWQWIEGATAAAASTVASK